MKKIVVCGVLFLLCVFAVNGFSAKDVSILKSGQASIAKVPPASPLEDHAAGPQYVPPPVRKAPGSASTTINVPADYATIQLAINNAISNDIIVVAAGTYPEAILIDGKNLTIQGAGAGSSFITGTVANTEYIVKIINSAVVDLSGFTIDGTGKNIRYGVYAYSGTDGDIHDNEIKNIVYPGAAGLGIRRQECYIDVTDNTVYGFGRIGIYTRDDVIGNTDTGVISGNTVTGLGGSDPNRLSYGISVYSGNPTIDNNDIYNCVSGANQTAWASAGLDPWTGSTSIISNNNFYNCDYGILSNSASPVMSGNTFTNTTYDDVRLDYFVKGNPTPHWAEYYNTIQIAINAIPATTYPVIVWIGIYSGGGTYAEAVNITKSCQIWGNSRATVLVNPVGYAVNSSGIYIAANDVILSGLTLQGSNTNSLPRYGIKFGAYDGCYLDDVEVRNLYRTGVDILGATNLSVTNVELKYNGGNGLQMSDASNVTLEDITTSNNAWGGIGIFTNGRYTPIGTSGIVFSGTNSFGETSANVGSIYLEEGNYSAPLNPYPITYSTNIMDGADVTLQLADVTHALNGNSDVSEQYTRFYATFGDVQTAAAGAVSHILDGRYITELAGTDLYVPGYLGGVGPAVTAAKSGDVVHVDAGSFTTSAQVVVNKDLTIEGAGSGSTTISPTFNTGSSGDSRGWFLVATGFDFDLSGVTLDGTGYNVYQAIRNKGLGSCADVAFNEIKHPGYSGVAIAAFGTGPVNVTNCTFTEIGRVGVLYFGSVVNVSAFSGNTYTGKGVGDWLDYALDISAGAIVTVSNNVISGNRGVASSDGSTSAGILVTTYYGTGTEATITNNILTDNTTGIGVGYDASDASVVEAHNNSIYGNDTGVNSTAPVVDALSNWWGNATGPFHTTLNPGGLGNKVSDNVLFDPWLTGLNQISVVPAYDITNCSTNLTYTFHIEQPVGPLEIRGYNVQFQIDPLVVTTSTGAIAEEPYLDAVGDGQFFAINNGGGIYTVSCAILGGSVGATGAGDLFTVEFTPVGEGTSDITIKSLMVRDLNNVPLSAASTGGSVQVDCTVPTMEPIAEAEGQYYNTAPAFSNFGFDDDVNLDLAEYQIDSNGWVTLFSGIDAAFWDNDGWALPGFAALSEGTHTVYFRVKDDADNWNGEGTPDTYSWQFFKDMVAPDPPSDFTAAPGHNKVHLTWTNPTGDPSFVGVEIRRVSWRDYPHYATTAPSYPADEMEGTFIVQTGAEAYDNNPVNPRDIYYFSAFSYDVAGNYSVFDAGAADRATNYWLGDIDSTGAVNVGDLVVFSGTFGTTEGGGGFIPESDFGPSDDWSRFGIPEPDNAINFEDLMIFAMNYGNVSPAGTSRLLAASPAAPLSELVSIELTALESKDGEITIAVVLKNKASQLKGVNLVIDYGLNHDIVRIERGALLTGKGDNFFGIVPREPGKLDVSVAALGVERPLEGSGEIARLIIKQDPNDPVRIRLEKVDLRDVNNVKEELLVDSNVNTPYIPSVSALMQNHPNPFNPATTIMVDVARAGTVTVQIFDVSGRLVRTLLDEHRDPGQYTIEWDGRDGNGSATPAGVYFYRMKASGYQSPARKMVLIK